VLDLAEILELGHGAQPVGPATEKIGLVLRMGELTAAAQVERVESIIRPVAASWRRAAMASTAPSSGYSTIAHRAATSSPSWIPSC